jgi:peptidoglycan/xylan/chitin deacetylase (PgdA/CDA1 family)
MVMPSSFPKAVVLCYHSVHPRRPGALPTPALTPELFALHLSWLKAHCDIIPFRDVLEATQKKTDRPLVSITFDDGYADNYEYAFPLLRRHGVHGTFFLTAGFLEKDPKVLERLRTVWRPRHLRDQIRPLEWSYVREMRRAGMDFGAHTYGHFNLAGLSADATYTDLKRARDVLEERLGERITLMAYPFGKPRRHFTNQTVNLVAKVGYEYAAAIICRRVHALDSPLVIPRFYVMEDGLSTLKDKTSGAWDLLGYLQERLPGALIRE